MLSRESNKNEMTWSQGAYIEPDVLVEAFKLPRKLPTPVGIYANQPNPWGDSHQRVCRMFWKFALLAIAVQAFFVFIGGGKQVLNQSFLFDPRTAEDTVQTRDFVLKDRSQKVTVRNSTSLANNWIGLELTLVNKVTGAAWPTGREIAYYYGSDGGESWSEGNREDEVVFIDIPAGTYYLAIDPDMPSDKPVAVNDKVEVFTGGTGWSNFVLVMIFLVIFPIFTRMRHAAFEAKRWGNSDFPPVTSSDSDSDD
jgi:hypothetical protein